MRTPQRPGLFLFSALQIAIFTAAAAKPAHAYVDPGSGLLAFQVGGSMLAGALFVMRAKLRKLFRLKPKSQPATNRINPEVDSTSTGTDG